MRDELVVVDAHAHLQLGERTLVERDGPVTVEQQFTRLDRFGIDAAIVIADVWAGWTMGTSATQSRARSPSTGNHCPAGGSAQQKKPMTRVAARIRTSGANS